MNTDTDTVSTIAATIAGGKMFTLRDAGKVQAAYAAAVGKVSLPTKRGAFAPQGQCHTALVFADGSRLLTGNSGGYFYVA